MCGICKRPLPGGADAANLRALGRPPSSPSSRNFLSAAGALPADVVEVEGDGCAGAGEGPDEAGLDAERGRL